MRKLISATMPSACGPHCCMTMKGVRPAELRPAAQQLQQGHHALAHEAEHRRAAGPGLQARLADPLEERRLHVLAGRVVLFRHGLGSAISFARPAGRVLARNSTFPLAQRSWSARMRTIKALSQRPSSCASNSNAFTRCRPVPSPPPRCPAGPSDPASRRRFRREERRPLSAERSAVREYAQDHSCFSVVVRVEGQAAGGKVREDNADRNEGQVVASVSSSQGHGDADQNASKHNHREARQPRVIFQRRARTHSRSQIASRRQSRWRRAWLARRPA